MIQPSALGALAGIDVGASGVRVAVKVADRTARASIAESLPRNNGHIDAVGLSSLIARGLANALANGPETVDTIALGMAGYPDLVESPEELATAIGRAVSARRVVLANDALTTHVGALGGASGTVIAAGTGAIALGTDHASTWTRADGWGVLLGDSGSGAWVGHQGLSSALRAADGRRDGSHLLLEGLSDRYGSVDRLVRAVYSTESPSTILGQFAPVVAEAARNGDLVARAIWANAGRHLAATAAAAALPGKPISWGGGLFAAGELLLEPFLNALKRACPGVVATPPQGTSVDGALELAAASTLDEHPSFLRAIDLNANSVADIARTPSKTAGT